MTETIIAAAIRILRAVPGVHDDVIVSMPRPHRHYEIMRRAEVDNTGPGDQGFLTSTGRYVDRYDGLTIARRAGQLLGGKSINSRELTSEDLW